MFIILTFLALYDSDCRCAVKPLTNKQTKAKAIHALTFIEYTFHNHFVFFSEAKSVLQAIINLK